jgi:hypothetical protein
LTFDFIWKLLVRAPRFRYRTPDLSDTIRVGFDSDAVYEVSVLDLVKFFRRQGFSIHNIAFSYNANRFSRLFTKLFPYLASVGLVAQKPVSRSNT